MATARRLGALKMGCGPRGTRTSWADAGAAKRLTRSNLRLWVARGAERIASQARQEAPSSTGAGRSWINATEDDTEVTAYAGIIGPAGTTRGAMPAYMGMIQQGITPHKVSLKHYSLRKWFARTFGEPEAKRSAGGFYRSVMVWKSTSTFGGIKRERTSEGKTAIPWFTRAIDKSIPGILADLYALSRGSNNMTFQTNVGTVRL